MAELKDHLLRPHLLWMGSFVSPKRKRPEGEQKTFGREERARTADAVNSKRGAQDEMQVRIVKLEMGSSA